MLVTKTTNGDDVVALTHAAVEASSEALARAKSATADLLDTGETRAEHELAHDDPAAEQQAGKQEDEAGLDVPADQRRHTPMIAESRTG